MDDDADATLPNTTTFTGLLPGTFSVTEGVVAGWALTGLDCSAGGSGDTGTRTATINLAAGANVTCTYTNTKSGSITIVKDAVPDSRRRTSGSRPRAPVCRRSAWTTTPTRRCPTSTTFAGLLPGSYSVTEGAVAGWALTGLDCSAGGTGDTGTRTATINLAAGADVTCTYTNTKLGFDHDREGRGPRRPRATSGSPPRGTGLSPFSLDDDADATLPNTTTFTGLLPGSYSVTERRRRRAGH